MLGNIAYLNEDEETEVEESLDETAAALGIPVLARLPIDPEVAKAYDSGLMETVDTAAVSPVIDAIRSL